MHGAGKIRMINGAGKIRMMHGAGKIRMMHGASKIRMMHGAGKSSAEDRESNDEVYCLAFSKPIIVTNYIHHNTHLSTDGRKKYYRQTWNTRTTKYLPVHSFCSLLYDGPTASCKTGSSQRAIKCFLFQVPVSSLFPKVIQQLLTSSSSSSLPLKQFFLLSVNYYAESDGLQINQCSLIMSKFYFCN